MAMLNNNKMAFDIYPYPDVIHFDLVKPLGFVATNLHV